MSEWCCGCRRVRRFDEEEVVEKCGSSDGKEGRGPGGDGRGERKIRQESSE